MKLVQKLLNKLNGLHYPQEYLCLAKESFQQPLHVYIVEGRRVIKDITHFHLFTGYSPLVFAISFPAEDNTELPASLEIVLSPRSFQQNETFEKKDAVARLFLKLIKKQPANNITIFYYEGVKGENRFVSAFHQSVIELTNRLYNKKEGNIFLADNLYCQVQIAYAVARIISLITVKIGDLYNLFPSDLHGAVNDQYYIVSLRHEGKACKQVEIAGRIVISQVNCQAYKTVYSLGKNHMQELKSKDNFPFGNEAPNFFNFHCRNQRFNTGNWNYWSLLSMASTNCCFLRSFLNRQFKTIPRPLPMCIIAMPPGDTIRGFKATILIAIIRLKLNT